MRRDRIVYALMALFTFGIWFMAEKNAWGGSGKQAPEKLSPDQVHQIRSGTPGAVHFVYWSHGYRGK